MTTRKHLTMATIRRDGSPRISGIEIQLDGGELRIGSMPGALKVADLRRDRRIAIHGPTHDAAKSGRWRGEAKIAGEAVEVGTSEDAHTFRIDVQEVVITQLNEAGDRLVIESWRPERGRRRDERT